MILAAAALALAALPVAASAAPRAAIAPAQATTPQLLLIHGGSFLYDDPGFRFLTEPAALAAGFVPHYLTYPLGDLRGAIRAARSAAIFLRRRYGGAVYAYGSSAGGTLAAILAGEGLVAAAVAKAPPSDLPSWTWPDLVYGPDYWARLDAPERVIRRFSPYRRRAKRPLLIVHGREDAVVPVTMSAEYAAKFRRVHLWTVPGGHWTERIRPGILPGALAWLRARGPIEPRP